MAPRIDIRANIAETGATQINNVNVSTSMQDPIPRNKTGMGTHDGVQATTPTTSIAPVSAPCNALIHWPSKTD